MTNSLFLIPIHINALYLDRVRTCVETMANFSRLPYFDGKKDINRNNGNVSELLISSAFQNQNLYLPPGIHLHWELPQTLSNGIPQSNSSIEFPSVPNRWLIIRKYKQTNVEKQVGEKAWIVESDYLWEIGKDAKSITIPFFTNPRLQNISSADQPIKNQPFRYLGRQISLEDWLKKSEGEYWGKNLTAVGYGEPTFSAFYPNCYSVFGFYDSEIREVNDKLSYDIFGWYSNKEYDFLRIYLEKTKKEKQSDTLLDQLFINFQENLKWKVNREEFEYLEENLNSDTPQILCYGRLQFQLEKPTDDITLNLTNSTKVILANSGTEALSAYLANEVYRTNSNKSLNKGDLENLLEALQLASSLEDEQLDLKFKLQDARHEKGFIATSADLIWIVEQVNHKMQNTQQKQSDDSQISLPENIARLLLEINLLEQQYNRLKHEIESCRELLFADWYKYILCSYPPIGKITEYPDPNLVRCFIEDRGVNSIQRRLSEAGDLLIGKNELGEVVSASSQSGSTSLATQLAAKINTLIQQIQEFNNSEQAKKMALSYQVKPIPGSHYWQPNEPVVMIVGDISKSNSTKSRNDNNLLDCFVWQEPNSNVLSLLSQDVSLPNISIAIQALLDKIETLITRNESKYGLTIWSEELWQPLLLEWEVGIQTPRHVISSRSYNSGFILQNYRLTDYLNDLEISTPFSSGNSGSDNVYTGYNILTPYAALQQEEKLQEYFRKQPLFEKYCQSKNLNKLSFEWLSNQDLPLWLEQQIDIPDKQKNLYITLVKTYQKLRETDCLSQCLGGLNQALLGRKQTLQLNISDPIGFSNYQTFIETVAQGVYQSIASAPQPLSFFNPIRLGSLKIQRLRLVDTFGTSRDVPLTEEIITPEYLRASSQDVNAFSLPPRLVQPARISFRWLSANPQYLGEAGSHPSLNPICGWILSDRIDKTIEIYNTEGRSLGELEIRKIGHERWRPAPFSSQSVNTIRDIPNPYLRRVVEYLDSKTDQFLQHFVLALSKAWENVEPNNFDSSPSLALLIGQPIAIVRASINLELQGLPAVNQDWQMFRQDLTRETRENNNFPVVDFPLYLGDYRRKDDGLIGYWLEDRANNLSESVYIPQARLTEQNRDKLIVTAPELISQSINSEPQIVTMFIDPRTSVHLVSGILPTITINISQLHYVEALSAIETTFLTAPILTPGKMFLPILEEQGYSWSWLEQETSTTGKKWSEISSIGEIEERAFIETVKQQVPDLDAQATWNYLLQSDVSWLKKVGEDRDCKFVVVPVDKRSKPDLDEAYKSKQRQIEFILDFNSIKIRQTIVEANFISQEIREGWLKLKKN